MADNESRASFFEKNPRATAWAALDHATNQQKRVTPGAIKLEKDQFAGKRAIILGSGVGGLATAYELLAQKCGMQVTVLEALNRTGGRCLSLRTGDTLTEDKNSKLFDSEPGETQVVRFKRPVGDAEPYLNARPRKDPVQPQAPLGLPEAVWRRCRGLRHELRVEPDTDGGRALSTRSPWSTVA